MKVLYPLITSCFLSHGLLTAQDGSGNLISPIAELIAVGEVPPAPAVDVAIRHTIQSGDNPWTVAKKYGITMEDLLAANDVVDVKNLQIGQVLTIPLPKFPSQTDATITSPAGSPAVTAEPEFDSGGYDVYTIKKGDNPWIVAKRLKLDYETMLEINQITNPRDLKIGQKIRLPKKGETAKQPVISPESGETAEPFDADGHEVYIIKNGDNPWTIARRLKIDYQKLLEINQITDPRDLKIGQKLKLPKSS